MTDDTDWVVKLDEGHKFDGCPMRLEFDDEQELDPSTYESNGLSLRLSLDQIQAVLDMIDSIQASLENSIAENPVFTRGAPEDCYVRCNVTLEAHDIFTNVSSLRFLAPGYQFHEQAPTIQIDSGGDLIDFIQIVGRDPADNPIRLWYTTSADKLFWHLDEMKTPPPTA